MSHVLRIARHVLFGRGTSDLVPGLVRELGTNALIVTGSSLMRIASVMDGFERADIQTINYRVTGEPTLDVVREALAVARQRGCTVVVGWGGGSALDVGKAVAMLLTNGRDPLDYMEVIGKGKKIRKPSAPFIAVPTTAGTGTEVTTNAVLLSTEHRLKASLRSPHMLPRIAVVDPLLTVSMPPELTASTGLDAMTQVIEPYVCREPNLLTDPWCWDGIRRAARSLGVAYQDGDNLEAREDMSVVSLMGGMALANGNLGAVHGLAGPIGGKFGTPHGMVCARLLPFVMEMNVRALDERQPDALPRARYDQVARLITGSSRATAAEGIRWVSQLCGAMRVPGLGTFGIRMRDAKDIVKQSRFSSSMRGNPIDLTKDELTEIVERAI